MGSHVQFMYPFLGGNLMLNQRLINNAVLVSSIFSLLIGPTVLEHITTSVQAKTAAICKPKPHTSARTTSKRLRQGTTQIPTLESLKCKPQTTARGVSPRFRLIWQTDFNEPPTSKDWNVYNTGFYKKDRCFFGGNVFVRNGIVNLVGEKAPTGPCSSNAVASAGLDTYNHHIVRNGGRWEVRAKMAGGLDANGKSINYGFDSYIGVFAVHGFWPYEVDFAEHIGAVFSLMHLTQHWEVGSTHPQIGFQLSGNTWSNQFHTYATEIIPKKGTKPGEVRYYVDSVLVGTQPLHFVLTDAKLAIGYLDGACGSWIGCPREARAKGFPPTDLSSPLQVDWVKIYQYQ
jgi:hypothetical protein